MRTPPSPGLAAVDAESAALDAVARAEAAALAGVTQGRIAYTLTYNMIKQDQGALSFPLIALAFTAIAAGLTAYAATEVAGALAEAEVSQEFQVASQRVATEADANSGNQ